MTAETEPTLWDVLAEAPTGPLQRTTDTPSVGPSRAAMTGGQIAALIAHYEHPEGLTDFELAYLTGSKQTSIGKRRHELCGLSAGRQVGPALIEATGTRRVNTDGNPSAVWRITEVGMRAARAYRQYQAAA